MPPFFAAFIQSFAIEASWSTAIAKPTLPPRFSRKSVTFRSRDSSSLTRSMAAIPTTVMSGFSACSLARCGMARTHGGHQVAQNSIT